MSHPITVTHRHGENITVAAAGTEILNYVYKPDPVEYESRKPYVHPLRTLAGSTVTGYRPNDHRWHKGLQLTASHVSGQNFWGGHSYVTGEGYRELPERIGSMRHDEFESFEVETDELRFTERLHWLHNDGTPWAREHRSIRVHSVDPERGSWALDWSIRLVNVREQPLRFGSPTTAGREMAGYTGLHWRGPREFTGGDVLGPGGISGEAGMMGRRARWLGFVGEHDEVDRCSTVVFEHAPANDHAIHESHWFVRSEPTPAVALSWAFFEEFALPPGEDFSYTYRILLADGARDHEQIERELDEHSW
ncbi:hypothetical protein J2S53_001131 [Actinopolyspora lacussalsi]|nr:hypothetical protein [Actinopolyspora lacussalsi]